MDDIVYRVSWEALDKTGKPLASGVAHGSLARVIDILMQSDEKMLASLEAMTDYDVGTADRMASQAEDLLFKARAKYKASHALSSGEKAAIEKVLATDGQLAAFLHRIVFVVEKSDEFIEKGQHVKDVEGLLAATKEMELLAYDIQSIAVDMDAFATSYSKVLKDPVAGGIYKMRGYDSSYVGIYRGLAVEYGTIADELLALADSIYQEYDVGQSVSETELQASQPVVDSSLVPPELARFFKGFDSDQDGELAIGEAQAFYSWVEENVAYRYDDEKTTNPEQGYAVGDGRKSTDYRQTPYETYKERAGDCEDTATLEQALYSYFGVAALIVGVNSVAQSQIDHAATIVLIGGTPEEFREILGDLVYYDIEDGNYNMYGSSVQPGTYMLVDNAYSNGFGYVSGGLEEGAFTISCYIPLENGYGEEWNEVVDQCAIPFD
jgi:hypothetical protein